MSYIVGAFVVAALLIAALVVPGVRLAAGIALIVTGVLCTMAALFFGPVMIAAGVVALLIELYSRRVHAPAPPPAARTVPPTSHPPRV